MISVTIGLLLAGAIANYSLQSIVPLSILALIVLSHFIKEARLVYTLSTYIEMIIPGYAATLTEQVRVFIAHGKSVGSFVFLAMPFFSSIAFTVLESAMCHVKDSVRKARGTPSLSRRSKDAVTSANAASRRPWHFLELFDTGRLAENALISCKERIEL